MSRFFILHLLFPRFCLVILFSTFYFLDSNSVLAASVGWEAPGEVGVNQRFQADVFLDTQGENINAVEGEFEFPRGFLGLKEISDGDSIINFWIQRPKLNLDNKIIFSGIIPAGYSGKGKVFSVVFQALALGEAPVKFSNLKILLNDGSGTPVQASVLSASIKISNIKASEEILGAKLADSEPPESFQIYLSNDESVFGGKWFIVFATQDKNSGIERYEILENRKWKIESRSWETAESPYLLEDQSLSGDVYVRAFDRAGNYRTEHLAPVNPLNWYENWLIWIIIIIVITMFFYARRKKINAKNIRKNDQKSA
ncbi:MAG: hypothetical protein UW85_C0019G0002 [Parcubacteria group bacterium GW2011_GWA1_Parcubacteria_45_10]|nr:MAG: hypothetical protein UW85_C0019G0002 [Parcubacteria group bacterium GW2011_GWA1_Parcubacteria_45_10]KKT87552.1 MAG: hypothetical protein UW89_C0024G0004 [Parcubacteria group bacterium GW2011_GWB1_45_10]